MSTCLDSNCLFCRSFLFARTRVVKKSEQVTGAMKFNWFLSPAMVLPWAQAQQPGTVTPEELLGQSLSLGRLSLLACLGTALCSCV